MICKDFKSSVILNITKINALILRSSHSWNTAQLTY